MKIACGTDIIEISRMKEAIEKNPDRFCHTVFTENEIAYCEGKNKSKMQHYAARFAAKEATFKAISHLVKDKYSISWRQIEVQNDESGRPEIVLHLPEIEKRIMSKDISLSHSKEYATANVVLLYT